MCRSATCNTCNGKTWFGCGAHKPSVLDHIPKEQWCTCEKKSGDADDEYPPMGSMPSSLRPHETTDTITNEMQKTRNELGGIPKEPPQEPPQEQQQQI